MSSIGAFRMTPTRLCAASIVAVVGLTPVLRADWPQFRGPAANGHAASAELPIEWSVKTGKN